MTLPGPSRTIIVEPLELPAVKPRPPEPTEEPRPEREPARVEPEREPSKVPA